MTSAGPEAVKVIVRCRPMNKREKELNSKVRNIVFNQGCLIYINDKSNNKNTSYY